MTKKWIAINLILLAGVSLLGWRLYVAAKTFKEQNNPAHIVRNQPRQKSASEAELPPLQAPRKYSDAEFAIIPGQDLFVESRKKEEKIDAVPPPPETRTLDIKPILIGVLIAGSQKVATIQDPAPGAAGMSPGGRRTVTMRPGDNYRGFVLEFGSSREVIPLFDSSKPPQSGKTPILATQVVRFGPGGPAGGVNVGGLPVVNTAAAPGGRAAGMPVQAPTPNTRPPAGQARGAVIMQGGGPIGGMVGQSGAGFTQGVDARGRQMINTPFGVFQVPAQQAQPVKK